MATVSRGDFLNQVFLIQRAFFNVSAIHKINVTAYIEMNIWGVKGCFCCCSLLFGPE